MSATGFFTRYRVRLGYPLAVVVLLLARPTPVSILQGALIGLLGLSIRAYAAGYLHKQKILTMTGPYARTRNPLYLGSAILTVGASVATHSWPSALVLCVYFALFYSIVMRMEEQELHLQHGSAFDEYARSVPLFLPRLRSARLAARGSGSFSILQYKKNHEWQAAVGFVFLLLLLLGIWRFRQF